MFPDITYEIKMSASTVHKNSERDMAFVVLIDLSTRLFFHVYVCVGRLVEKPASVRHNR